MAAEVGHLDLAAEYLAEAALMDLQNLQHNAKDGLHIASLAGGWLAVVAGFGGLRDLGERLTFRPQLPPGWTKLRFSVHLTGQRLHVEIGPDSVVYSVDGDQPLTLTHLGDGDAQTLEVEPGQSVTRPWQAVVPKSPAPGQPAGREPFTRPPDLAARTGKS